MAAQMLDSGSDVEDKALHVPIELCVVAQLCNELTLAVSPLHIKAFDLGFFVALTTKVDVLLHYLLSKCLNQPCQTRRFAKVSQRELSKDYRSARHTQELVLCSLLGNYQLSAPNTRPSSAVRDILFTLLRKNGNPSVWLMRLLDKCSVFIKYCMREHLCFIIEDQPAVQHQISGLMEYDTFKTIVTTAMGQLREYVNSMLLCKESSLYRDALTGVSDLRWVEEVSFILKPFDTAMLRITYSRVKKTFREFMLSVSNKIDMEEIETMEAGGVPVAPLVRWVSVEEIGALRQLAERLSSWRCGILWEVVNWLDSFGVPRPVLDFIHLLMKAHQYGTTPLERLKQYLRRMHRDMPRVFQLVQIAAIAITDSRQIRLIGRLPVSRIAAQVDACQGRLGMKNPQAGLVGSSLYHQYYFVYYDVCFSIYSLLAAFKSEYKQDYTFGLRDAVMDYQTGKVYCQRDMHNYRGSCSAQPLREIFLLGNVLEVAGKIVQMCPQPKCGRAFVMDRRGSRNLRGTACCYCTQTSQESFITMSKLIAYYNTSEHPRGCMYCGVKLTQSAQVFLYPQRVYVCRQHHSPYLAQRTVAFLEAERQNEAALVSPPSDQERRNAMEQFMRQTIQMRENDRRAKKARVDKLAQSKRTTKK